MPSPKILIVEDDTSTAAMIRGLLISFGYSTSGIVSSGEDAIEKCERFHPNLVLMDIKLEGEMDGIEAAQQIHRRFNIPVVFLTSYADNETLQRAKVSDPFGYIIKPIEKRELHTAIEIALYRYKMEKKLNKNQQLLRATLKGISDAVIATDADGRIMFINEGAEELTGWSWEEALGMNLFSVFNIIWEDSRTPINNIVEEVSKKGFVFDPSQKIILISKQGQEFPVENNATLIKDDRDNVTGVVIVSRNIIRRRQTAKALDESEKRYEILFQNTAGGILAADIKTKKIKFGNPSICKMLGYSQAELLQMNVTDIHPKESLEHALSEFDAQARGEKTLTQNIPCLRKDGRIIYVDINTTKTIIDGNECNIGFFSDITDRKKAVEAMIESEAEWRSLVENAPDIIMTIDKDYKILYMNRPFFDAAIEEAIGESIYKYFPLEHKDTMWKMLEKVFNTGEIVSFEIKVDSPNSAPAWFSIRLGPIRFNGSVIAAASFITDITQRKLTEEQKKKLQDQLTKAEKMESLGLLAGGVAHDLNNIITPLVAYPDLILIKIPKDSPAVKYIKRLGKSAEEAAAVIQDLLTMARRGRYIMVPTNLNDVIENYLDSPGFIRLGEEHPEIDFQKGLDENLPDIMGSATHLLKVVMNLIVNAYDAMQDGGLLTVETSQQYLEKLINGHDKINKDDYVVFKVRDTGVGIDSADIEKIFEPYYSNKEIGRSGSGLGLSVVYGIIKDHGGYYDINTEPGKGTEFIFYFPVLKVSPDDDTLAGSDDKKTGGIKGVDFLGEETILVVDDCEEHRNLTFELLISQGYNVHTVVNGKEALEYLNDNQVDMVVLDMVLEESFDALDTYREIQKISPGQKAIIISGYSPTQRVEELQMLGAGQFVRKPFSRQTLSKAIRQELDKKETILIT
jgi:PAS domain S-box-containing protein